ncbi:30S ribosomal protein S16 [Candidatus Daviesbacteria bacterium RIFCSPLOWO2_02_FULL_36_8]|uniref:Small ribosomal subunit protein bS16 n=1 Tax=Candidatus Daviesbacteria bacterium RIFCSPLOWO2_02_FULL_36_8 TaxID=1797793 RepID=A0A1F5MG95_9BACT|nr:MAG: 30S ribosomal protein S16 [Candidatus Daviesbacteria bacterium RIFCSPLOWO2_02_FULL_36_8]
MLKIRLSRIGGKQRPFYRVVVVEERSKRTGSYVELLGTYNPLSEPKEIKLKQDRIDYWIKQGAQPSVGYLRIIGKAPQRPPRKAKKERKEEPKAAPIEAPVQEAPAEEVKSEEPATGETSLQEGEVKSDADSRLSEAGEVSSESTSIDVHEPDQAGSEQSEEAELENQVQTNEPKVKAEEIKDEGSA